MPIVIINAEGKTPLVIERPDEAALLRALAEVEGYGEPVMKDREIVREWLAGLDAPSGWYDTQEEAEAAVKRAGVERDAQLMKAALERTGWTQRRMAAALGLSDPKKDGSPVRKILLAHNGLSGTARRTLAYVLKHGPMEPNEEQEILSDLDGGSWRRVSHAAIRRH